MVVNRLVLDWIQNSLEKKLARNKVIFYLINRVIMTCMLFSVLSGHLLNSFELGNEIKSYSELSILLYKIVQHVDVHFASSPSRLISASIGKLENCV